MKKLTFIVTILFCITLLFAGCSGSSDSPDASTAAGSTVEPAETVEPADTVEPAESVGDQADESSASGVIEPEQVISKEEAGQLLGEPVLDGEMKEQPVVGQKLCYYGVADESSLDYLQISIVQQAFMEGDSNTPESIYTTTKDALIETGEQQEVSGIGGEYFFGTPGLHILTDGFYINIAAGNSDDAKVQEILKNAGALAVKNLKALLG